MPASGSDLEMDIVGVPTGPWTSFITPELILAALRKGDRSFVRVHNEYTIKVGRGGSLSYEYRVLQMLEGIGDVPCPRPLDFFTFKVDRHAPHTSEREKTHEQWQAIVMTTVTGQTLQTFMGRKSREKSIKILQDVRRVMERINVAMEGGITFINKDGNQGVLSVPSSKISSLDGDRCLQFPLEKGWVNQSVDTEDFVSTMTEAQPQPADQADMLQLVLATLQPTARNPSQPFMPKDQSLNSIRFCHMDLHSSNIMVHKGRLSGIIDWEYSGWYNTAMDQYYSLSKYVDLLWSFGEIIIEAWDINPTLVDQVQLRDQLYSGSTAVRKAEYKAETDRLKALGIDRKRRRKKRPVTPELSASLDHAERSPGLTTLPTAA